MSGDKNDDFGNRMKEYEGREAQRRFLPLLPICVRIDGKNFSNWTRGFERPYDARLSDTMIGVTRALMEESNAVLGYTQSDEISLILYSDNYKSQVYFDGKIQKLVSVLASMATGYFNVMAKAAFKEQYLDLAFFDCRVWAVPNLDEAANAILWREKDATKNSISMAARHYYSHKELHLKSGSEMQEMLFQKGVNWNDYPAFFKRGTFLLRKTVTRSLNTEELRRIPEPHRSRVKDEMVDRSDIRSVWMPSFSKVVNRVGVIFLQEEPVVDSVVAAAEGDHAQ